jgi:probable lipoprotein NlpC
VNKIIIFALFAALLLFAGCSSKTIEPELLPIVYEEPVPVVVEESKDTHWVSKALHKEYDKWCETPYLYGGNTLQGTDCSSLVQKVYLDAFGVTLPRTSEEQAKIGYKVSRKTAKEGDLVFFKINSKTRHSGIMIDKGKFLHASTHKGVIISSLYDPYWRRVYVQTRRVLPE